tara:strand:- start:892 stop:1122 length:231 start_codon:yes stop_codon:yes gene_type:complete
MKELKKIGTLLSREELKNLFGGRMDNPNDTYHGRCENGTMFTFRNSSNPSGDEEYINDHYCQGSGVAWVSNRVELL